jgi:hypothetical protein
VQIVVLVAPGGALSTISIVSSSLGVGSDPLSVIGSLPGSVDGSLTGAPPCAVCSGACAVRSGACAVRAGAGPGDA